MTRQAEVVGATFCYLGASDLDTRTETYRRHPSFSLGPVREATLATPIQLLSKISKKLLLLENKYFGGLSSTKEEMFGCQQKTQHTWLKPAGCLSSTELEV